MGKRKGEWLSFMALLLVFMLTTLFFYMVYTMHYDSASDDFTGFTVFDYQSEPGAQASAELGTLREDLDGGANVGRLGKTKSSRGFLQGLFVSRNCRFGLCGMVPKNLADAL